MCIKLFPFSFMPSRWHRPKIRCRLLTTLELFPCQRVVGGFTKTAVSNPTERYKGAVWGSVQSLSGSHESHKKLFVPARYYKTETNLKVILFLNSPDPSRCSCANRVVRYWPNGSYILLWSRKQECLCDNKFCRT